MKTRITYISILLTLFAISASLGQNVGIGTTEPDAKLHIKSSQSVLTVLNENFKEGVINPTYLDGDRDWIISNQDPYEDDFSIKAPNDFLPDQIAVIKLLVNTPVGKDIRLEFAFKHDDLDDLIKYEVTTPSETYELNHTSTWKTNSNTFTAVSSQSEISFKLSGLGADKESPTFLDAIKVTYVSDPAFKLEDGSEHSGGILQSDASGNASWVDLRSEINQQVGDATQTLLFRTTNNRLEISDGNQVRIQALSNDQFKSLELNDNSLDLTPGASFTIGKAPSAIGFFHYDGPKGNLHWGRDLEGYTSDANYTTRWGRENILLGDYSTAWGNVNIASSSSVFATVWGLSNYVINSPYATVWGDDNTVSGDFSTVWGKNNESNQNSRLATIWGKDNQVTSDSLGTTWGVSNKISAYNGTAWGSGNEVKDSSGTSWGVNNIVNAPNGTAWGLDNSVTGKNATAIGYNSTATGDNSMAIGAYAQARSFGELAIGRYNFGQGSKTEWRAEDNAFSIGDGREGAFGGWNSFVIKKDGKTGIQNPLPEYYLDINILEGRKGIRLANYDGGFGVDTEFLMDGNWQAIKFQGEDDNIFSINYTKADNYFTIRDNLDNVFSISNKQIGINESLPSYDLHLRNNSAAKPGSSSWTVASDRRLKKNIKPFDMGLDVILKMNPVWFTYNGRANMPEMTSVGTIAQELERIVPHMVSEWERDEEKYKAVDYGSMDFILVNAIKEQQAQIEANEKLLKEVKKEVEVQAEIIKKQQVMIETLLQVKSK